MIGKTLGVAATLLALSDAVAVPYARMGVKGGQYNVDGYNALGFDTFGFRSTGVDQWGRHAADPDSGLLPPNGKANGNDNQVRAQATDSPTPTPTASSSSSSSRSSSSSSRSTTTTHVKPHKTKRVDPVWTPLYTPVYTTINGSVVPHPTQVFPTTACYDGFVTFVAKGLMDAFTVQMYLAQAASVVGISELDLIKYGYDARNVTAQNETEITVLFCEKPIYDQVVRAAADPQLSTRWQRIGTIEILYTSPDTTPNRVIFECPDSYYLSVVPNVCLPCPTANVNNCTLVVCTSAVDSTCAANRCATGYYNQLPNLPSPCLPCSPVIGCYPNATVCSTQYNGVCPLGQCVPPYYFNAPDGSCFFSTP